jgi:hypothetical protein
MAASNHRASDSLGAARPLSIASFPVERAEDSAREASISLRALDLRRIADELGCSSGWLRFTLWLMKHVLIEGQP